MKKVFIILICFLLCSCVKNETNNELNVLNWSSYIPMEVINDFEKNTGIKVNYNTYSSNEELLAKISSSIEGTYDLVFPSDYMVELMIKKNMLEKIDKSKIVNFSNINNIFLNQPYDPNNDYSLPFLAATTVIAYNTNYIKQNIISYKDLNNKEYKNDIVFLDDQRIVIGAGLLANGYNINSINSEELNVAKKWLKDLKSNIKAYDSDSPKTFLITEETNIAFLWNAEAKIAQNENNKIKIIYPNEGHVISLDNYVILKNAKHQDNAYEFIDYLLQSNVSKIITDEYPYINTTIGARNMNEYELYEVFNKGFYINNIDEYISLYDKIWAEIK